MKSRQQNRETVPAHIFGKEREAKKLRDEARTGSESKQTLIHGSGALRRSISCPAPFFRAVLFPGEIFLGVEQGKEGGTQFSDENSYGLVYEGRSNREVCREKSCLDLSKQPGKT